MNYTEACETFTGPIPTLRTPFTREGEVDHDALRKMIDFDIEAGAKAVVLTAGDSHYEILSDDQILQVTRTTAQHARGRAVVVASDRSFDTRQALAFADTCRRLGVDTLMVKPPDWAASCTEETLAEHYAVISRCLPVMLVTGLFRGRGTAFGLNTIERTLEKTSGVVAVKDDVCGEFARRLTTRFRDRLAIWAGGQKQNHMDIAPYGAHGYLSSFLTFKPEVAHRYWAAWERGDIGAATAVIDEIDRPFFDFIIALTGGFDAGMHGALELFGLAGRWRPSPYHSLGDDDMERLKGFFKEKGLA